MCGNGIRSSDQSCSLVCVCLCEKWFTFFNVGVCCGNTLQPREKMREREEKKLYKINKITTSK